MEFGFKPASAVASLHYDDDVRQCTPPRVSSGSVRVVSELVEPSVPWTSSGTSARVITRSTEWCVDEEPCLQTCHHRAESRDQTERSASIAQELREQNPAGPLQDLCRVVSDIAIFVLKRDVKLQLTNLCRVPECSEVGISEFVFPSSERSSELGSRNSEIYWNSSEQIKRRNLTFSYKLISI